MTHGSTAAWQELLAALGTLDRSFLEGDRAVTDDRHIADGYRTLAITLGVALDAYLFPEPGRPQFVAVNTPFRRDRRWAATTPTPTTSCARSIRSGATASVAIAVTACTFR
jgi:hypothetical protein